MIRRMIFLLSCSLLLVSVLRPGGAAQGGREPAVRRIQVIGKAVTVRELLPAATEALTAEEADRVVIRSLRPGEKRALSAGEVALALLQAGIDPAARGLSLQAVSVERAAQVVPSEAIVQAGVEEIERMVSMRPGDELEVTVLIPPKPMLAPVGELTLEAVVRRPALRGVSGRVGKEGFRCTLRYRVRVVGPVLVTRRPVRRHEALSAEMVALEKRELTALRGTPIAAVEELAGKRAARGAAAGSPVTSDWLELVPAVAKGDSILAVTRVGAVSACARLVAAAAGAVGELIPARGIDGKSEVMVRVTGPGRGEIASGPKRGGQ